MLRISSLIVLLFAFAAEARVSDHSRHHDEDSDEDSDTDEDTEDCEHDGGTEEPSEGESEPSDGDGEPSEGEGSSEDTVIEVEPEDVYISGSSCRDCSAFGSPSSLLICVLGFVGLRRLRRRL